jgi:hypothetical protein
MERCLACEADGRETLIAAKKAQKAQKGDREWTRRLVGLRGAELNGGAKHWKDYSLRVSLRALGIRSKMTISAEGALEAEHKT